MDAYSPLEMALKAESIGVAKVRQGFWKTFLLAVLAGSFVALGACLYTMAVTDSSMGYGLTRLIGGLAFCLGLILVVLAGAELFTGNNLIVIATVSRRVSVLQLIRNWLIVYAGNFVGSVLTAGLVYYSWQWKADKMAVGVMAYNIAGAKMALPFVTALCAGALCNALVCLAVWLCYGARSTTDKILAIVFPVTAFVALGFEHSVANMYIIPYAMMLSRTGEFVSNPAVAGAMKFDPSTYTLGSFLTRNLLPVTIGNIVGGSFMVGLVYWTIYLRGFRPDEVAAPSPDVVDESLEDLSR
jgi:formate/nitrite transporter